MDTYHDERHPVVRMVLRFSGGLLRLGLARRGQLRLVRKLAGPRVTLGPLRRRAANTVSGLGIGGRRPPGAHLWTGRRAADPAPADGSRLCEALRDGRFVLVTGDGDPNIDGVRCVRPAAAGPTLLVRPDGYIGWSADRPDPAGVAAGMTTWIRPAT